MIGALRYQIGLLAPVRTGDAGGGGDVAWTETASVFAAVEQLTAATGLAGDRSVKRARIAATIRQRTGLVAGHRMRFHGTDYEITSIESGDGRRGYATLIGEEVLS